MVLLRVLNIDIGQNQLLLNNNFSHHLLFRTLKNEDNIYLYSALYGTAPNLPVCRKYNHISYY